MIIKGKYSTKNVSTGLLSKIIVKGVSVSVDVCATILFTDKDFHFTQSFIQSSVCGNLPSLDSLMTLKKGLLELQKECEYGDSDLISSFQVKECRIIELNEGERVRHRAMQKLFNIHLK